jgi:hypothetical protein
MSNFKAALVNMCNIPELSEIEELGLEQTNRCKIVVQAVNSTFDYGNSDMCLGRNARIDTAVADVGNLDATLATVLQ